MKRDADKYDKDEILKRAFSRLASRGIASSWSNTPNPFSDLHNECCQLMQDQAFVQDLQGYLRSRTIISRAITMFFTQVALAASTDWSTAPVRYRGVAARGWFLGRWIPTFLIIDGPVGRFVCGNKSPLYSRLGAGLPLLTAAQEFLSNALFRTLRNGFAHYGFDWEVVNGESYVIAYDWEKDLPIAKLHQQEADAFHIIAFALIQILDDVIISRRNELLSDKQEQMPLPPSEPE